jgi:hypothetical protein
MANNACPTGVILQKVGGGVGCRLERIRLRGTVRHGVISVPALERRVIRG